MAVIAFSCTRSGHYAICVSDPDGGQLTQLTTPYGAGTPSATPPHGPTTGQTIAFRSGLEHRYGNVGGLDADGSNRK